MLLKLPNNDTSNKTLCIESMVLALFVIYPNIAWLPCDLAFHSKWHQNSYLYYFLSRYLFFSTLIWLLAKYNLQKNVSPLFGKRLLYSFLITASAYLLYVLITIVVDFRADWLGSTLIFQFFVMCILTAVLGHTFAIVVEKQKKELEIEQLKTESLNSRYVALTNQINPHFFFNSLNGLTSLIRKSNEERAIEYVNKLSDVFRYVLQSDKKNLVTLKEELECVSALFYMMEVRFANKLAFHIRVDDEFKKLKIPVLSLLPVIDNIVVHNIIDTDHFMEVVITINEQGILSVANPIYPKLVPPVTNGTGLTNLETRFLLLTNKKIEVSNDGKTFTVYLPLIKLT